MRRIRLALLLTLAVAALALYALKRKEPPKPEVYAPSHPSESEDVWKETIYRLRREARERAFERTRPPILEPK